MTDNEIIKLLECCAKSQCSKCCYSKECDGYTQVNCALDLINRQQAEIARLRKEVNLVSIQFQDLQERYEEAQTEIEQWKEEANKYQRLWCTAVDDIETAKSEAIQEFAEKLKKRFYLCAGRCVVDVYHIDNLAKEYEKGK